METKDNGYVVNVKEEGTLIQVSAPLSFKLRLAALASIYSARMGRKVGYSETVRLAVEAQLSADGKGVGQ
jgi:hypothetical protein